MINKVIFIKEAIVANKAKANKLSLSLLPLLINEDVFDGQRP
jgi:hypothetical protein